MADIPIKQLNYDETTGGKASLFPITVPKAVIRSDGKNLEDILTDLSGSMSDAFSEEATYAVGDYCIYQDQLYKFIAEKQVGVWDESKVGRTTIEAELKSLVNQVSELNSGLNLHKTQFTLSSGANRMVGLIWNPQRAGFVIEGTSGKYQIVGNTSTGEVKCYAID